jgi:hypothetical protein
MSKINKKLQQGDVLIKPISEIPNSAIKIKPTKRGLVLAEGESTGHAHCIEEVDDAELYRIGEKMLLSVKTEVPLKHEEHKHIVIPPGFYEIGIVREKDWLSGMVKKVVD